MEKRLCRNISLPADLEVLPSLREFQVGETRTDNTTACKTSEAELREW